ncbi:PREDICTED: uncharacterized protein LOC105141701 [Populus euphratica]|uniref:Uncharacterized protein LOC105141701 n=1 Tax=Populus euphratica TaxID=75702 RepID=A0AAJ6VGW2_POPEU|nr:PREDICTED: uncharacterized protein LOC105141701 [Populus euphratica]
MSHVLNFSFKRFTCLESHNNVRVLENKWFDQLIIAAKIMVKYDLSSRIPHNLAIIMIDEEYQNIEQEDQRTYCLGIGMFIEEKEDFAGFHFLVEGLFMSSNYKSPMGTNLYVYILQELLWRHPN